MCVPFNIDIPTDVTMTEEERQRLRQGLSQSGDPVGAGTDTPAAGGGATGGDGANTNTAKPSGGLVTEAGNPGASGGLTPAEMAAQELATAVSDAQAQNTMLMQTIASQASNFGNTTTAIIEAQQAAAAALSNGYLSLTDQQKKAMEAAEQLRKNTGQASRKPNYSVSLKANANKNKSGISSTMLTGAGGVAASSLPLGRASLLGGA